MALTFVTNMMTCVKEALRDAIYQARIAVMQSGTTTWYYAPSIVKTIGNHYVQVDIPLDHTQIGTGTVTAVWLYDVNGNVLAKIDTSISRPTATDDIYFRAKINIRAELES